jgi:hypothetical protein
MEFLMALVLGSRVIRRSYIAKDIDDAMEDTLYLCGFIWVISLSEQYISPLSAFTGPAKAVLSIPDIRMIKINNNRRIRKKLALTIILCCETVPNPSMLRKAGFP